MNTVGKFAKKVVTITGASSGVGAATAVAFAKEGAKLAIHGRDRKRLLETTRQCRDSGADDVLEIVCDLRDFKNLEMLISQTVGRFSAIDILINKAAMNPFFEISELTLEEYNNGMDTNVRAPVFLCKYALPYLKKTKGSIVNVSSALEIAAPPGVFPYTMTKSALNHFTRGFAAECASFGIRVNAISLGLLDTKTSNPEKMLPEEVTPKAIKLWEMANSAQPLGPIQPQLVAENIMFLSASTHVTGTTFVLDGGFSTSG